MGQLHHRHYLRFNSQLYYYSYLNLLILISSYSFYLSFCSSSFYLSCSSFPSCPYAYYLNVLIYHAYLNPILNAYPFCVMKWMILNLETLN
jgi:hypothetical protein